MIKVNKMISEKCTNCVIGLEWCTESPIIYKDDVVNGILNTEDTLFNYCPVCGHKITDIKEKEE